MTRQTRMPSKGALPPPYSGRCYNCDAILSGNYCATCGQEARLHVASAREFLHEFVGHHIALEGKLWRTLSQLLFHPGSLTAEYIGCRRVRYIAPLRLYLTWSVLFFAIIKFSHIPVVTPDARAPAAPAAAAAAAEAASSAGASMQGALGKAKAAAAAHPSTLSAEVIKDMEEAATDSNSSSTHIDLGAVSDEFKATYPNAAAKAKQFSQRSGADQLKAFSDAFFGFAPYALFLMMPVFAFLLKILYLGSGRRYGEHLLFALHANAFAFIAIGAIFVVTRFSLPLTAWLNAALGIWLTIYLPLAMGRVYGGRRIATFLRWTVLMSIYVMLLMFALASATVAGGVWS
ncbi:MAG: DUF3667 domain-containing protein [Pseudomonadota bacterium]